MAAKKKVGEQHGSVGRTAMLIVEYGDAQGLEYYSRIQDALRLLNPRPASNVAAAAMRVPAAL